MSDHAICKVILTLWEEGRNLILTSIYACTGRPAFNHSLHAFMVATHEVDLTNSQLINLNK